MGRVKRSLFRDRYLEIAERGGLCGGERGGDIRYTAEIDTTDAGTRKLVATLAAKYHYLTFCYEAGPTGHLTNKPRPGRNDAQRNCTSNIMADGLDPALAHAISVPVNLQSLP